MSKKSPSTSCKEALAKWQKANPDTPLAEATKVKLICQLPSIGKMDSSLNALASCEQLSLSTNSIDKIGSLPGLKCLKILSLARNNIKRIEHLEDVSDTLEELWLSYNQIERLDNLTSLRALRVLYLSNNRIKDFDELLKVRELPALEELLLVGNPIYEDLTREQRLAAVLQRIPNLKKLDGDLITEAERQVALGT